MATDKWGKTVMRTASGSDGRSMTDDEKKRFEDILAERMASIDETQKRLYAAQLADTKATEGQANTAYMERLMQTCMMPMIRGISPQSVMQSAGMYIGLCLVSSDFRDALRQTRDEHRQEIQDRKDRQRYDRLEAKRGRAVETGDKDLADRMASRQEAIIRSRNGGRLPYTPMGAAQEHVALIERCYQDERVPGADATSVRARFKVQERRMFDAMKADGVSRKDFNDAECRCVNRLLEENPEYGRHFLETGFGTIGPKSASMRQTIKETPDGQVSMSEPCWEGTLQDGHGNEYHGGFSPRPKADMDGHLYYMRQSIAQGLDGIESAEDMQAYIHSPENQADTMMRANMAIDDGCEVTYEGGAYDDMGEALGREDMDAINMYRDQYIAEWQQQSSIDWNKEYGRIYDDAHAIYDDGFVSEDDGDGIADDEPPVGMDDGFEL